MESKYLSTTLVAMVSTLDEARRGTGRTWRTIKGMKDGDVYVVHSENFARYVRHEIKTKPDLPAIKILVVGTYDLHYVYEKFNDTTRGTRGANLEFDHAWVSNYYSSVIKGLDKNFDMIKQHAAATMR